MDQLNTDMNNIPLISVDISINVDQAANIGYESTQLMKRWMNKLPHLQKLLILFKHIFALNGFNKNFKGGIGSYCLFVMIAAYLQTYPPSDQDLLYKIFRDIVMWYKSFDNLHYIIWLQENGCSFLKVEEIGEDLYTRE
jgi:DNA polymerase sigma